MSNVYDGCLSSNGTCQLGWDKTGLQVRGNLTSSALLANINDGCLASNGVSQLGWNASTITTSFLVGTGEGGSLLANGQPVVRWSEDSGGLSTTAGSVLSWSQGGGVGLTGPVWITGAGPTTLDTANAELTYGSPSTIRPSLTCDGDVVSKGGGFFVLSDARTKSNVAVRNPQDDLALALALEPVSFLHHGSQRRQVGLLAKNTGDAIPEALGWGEAAVKDVMKNVDLRKVASDVFEVRPGLQVSGPVQVLQAGQAHVGVMTSGVLTGPFGEGGPAFVVGTWLDDALALNWSAVAAVTLNALKGLAQKVDQLCDKCQ